MNMAALTQTLKTPHGAKRRVGRPREHWVEDNIRRVYEQMSREVYQPDNEEHIIQIQSAAVAKVF